MLEYILKNTLAEEQAAHEDERSAQHSYEDSMQALKTEEASLQARPRVSRSVGGTVRAGDCRGPGFRRRGVCEITCGIGCPCSCLRATTVPFCPMDQAFAS